MDKKFEIGNLVKWSFREKVFRIIATKEIPYMQFGRNKIFPNEGCDFVIVENEIAAGEFSPFEHVNKEHLDKYEE